ncbi:hypothetical protein IC232_03545 [Microvirga sp. BT688]|uniref:hypothetical protein n=1 Tax=Microvirga sp. TaxID=1873136 RepID=UPI0016848BE8|nr:hypothetical protein [Microvirga sp.]MBD2745764.1 hypothetical protein [Microvirga sp.]
MRIPTSHRTLTRVAGFSLVATTLALGGCQTKTVSIPSNEPLVTTSPKVGNIGQSQLPAVAAATGKSEVSVAASSNSWVLRHLNAGKRQSHTAPQTAVPQIAKSEPQTKIVAPAASKPAASGKRLRDVSLAEVPLIDPNHYDPRRLR